MRFYKLGCSITASLLAISCTNSSMREVIVTNSTDSERPDELIVLQRSFIEEKTGKIPAGNYAIVTAGNQPLLVQYDDTDKDGNWDELAFLYSFKAEEKENLSFSVGAAPAAIKAVVRSHARHRRKNTDETFGPDLEKDSIPAGQTPTDFTKQALPPFLTEGPTWENDRVGFRIYFDVRNGKDVWGKTTAKPMMDEVGLDTSENYHLLADWGMDILKVGKSLGAGSLALRVPLAGEKDTLVRLGGINMGKVLYEKIADGPIRSIIRLHYPEWRVLDGMPLVHLIEEISIWGGQYFYESRVTVEKAPAGSKLVTGIVNLHSKQSYQSGTASHKILYTFDRQSENNDELGMALVIPGTYFSKYTATANEGTDVQNTYSADMRIPKKEPVIFRFYACWSRSDTMFSSADSFRSYLDEQAVLWGKKIEISE